MTNTTDDIVQYYFNGFCFNPPYRFVIGRTTKWDKTQDELLHVVDLPATAFTLFEQYRANDKYTPREVMYEYYLRDSFGRDAKDYCRLKSNSATINVA